MIFSGGQLDVIVATIAFGMGVDKTGYPHGHSHRAARQRRRLLPGEEGGDATVRLRARF